eukprot:SAG11_NODE_1975_length_3974_cov_47.788387_1_plen_66_part_10
MFYLLFYSSFGARKMLSNEKNSVYRRYKIIFASLSLSLALSLRATKPSHPPSIFPSRVFHTVNSIC